MSTAVSAAAMMSAGQRIRELEEELAVADKLLAERNRLLDAIPPCPIHGGGCVPHAIEWVEAQLIAKKDQPRFTEEEQHTLMCAVEALRSKGNAEAAFNIASKLEELRSSTTPPSVQEKRNG